MTIHVLYLAMCTVGVTQVLKQFIPVLTGKWALAAAVLTGALLSTVYILWPAIWDKVYIPLLAISAAVIFYDTIFKLFKNMIEKLSNSMSDTTYQGDN